MPSSTVPSSQVISSRAPVSRSKRDTIGTWDSTTHSQRPSGVTAQPLVKCGTARENVSTVPSASIRTIRPSSAPQPPVSLTNSVPSGAKAGQFGKPRSGTTRCTSPPS